jgi:hypothetical protein
MIGGWRPWERWMVACRLGRHARREGGEPPPDLLRRLREDIPASPELLRHLERPTAAADERRGASRRWLTAASLAAALTGSVVGLRVWQEHSRHAGNRPEALVGSDFASGAESRRANPGAPPSPAPSSPGAAPATVAAPVPFAPPAVAAPAPPSSTVASPAPRSLGVAGSLPRPAKPAARGASGGSAVPPGGAAGFGGTAGGVAGVAAPSPSAETGVAAGARDTAQELELRSEAAAGESAAQSQAGRPSDLERGRRGGASRPPRRSAVTAAGPTGMPVDDISPVERAGEAAPAPPPSGAAAKAAALPAARPGQPPGPATPLRSSFGADTGIDSYRRVRRGLLGEGHLPRAASVRADELANAFDLAAEVQAVDRPELSVEGAPLPAAGAAYLLRFEVRGLMGRSSPDAVEVDFDPTVVARFRRVGATAHRGGAAALYEVELHKAVAGAAPQMTAALPRPPGEPPAAPASRAGGDGAQNRVIATLRVVARDERSVQDGSLLAVRVVRLSELHPSWETASPALRVQGMAVQLAQALAAKDPAASLQALRARAQALAAELPEDPKATELLQLVDRAADLAGGPGGAAPRPPG